MTAARTLHNFASHTDLDLAEMECCKVRLLRISIRENCWIRSAHMAENSKIEWCDHTFNPWMGCQKVSPGCDHCYAEAMMDTRYGRVQWGPHGERVRTSQQNWKKPIQWNAQAHTFRKENGHRPRVFCASLADVFDNQVDASWRDDLFALIRECN